MYSNKLYNHIGKEGRTGPTDVGKFYAQVRSTSTTPARMSAACYALMILLLLMSSTYANGFSGGNLRRHDELACEGYNIHLRCPGKDIINVQAAAYGRQDDMTCVVEFHEMQDMHCRLPNAKEVVAERCNGNTSCDFKVGSEVFQDPCPGTKKYLNVMYECVPFIISCPGRLRSVSLSSRTSTSLEENAAWMKDPYQVSDKLFYMGYTKYFTRQLYEYDAVSDMAGGKPEAFYDIRKRIDGTGFVVFDRSLFFTPEETDKIERFDLSTQAVEASIHLPDANYGGISPYAIGLNTDIDLAVDENGLWAIYATEYNEGKIVISRLKHHNLEIIGTWRTDYDKVSALNAFVVCGVLYIVNAETLKIDRMFNTTSNIGTDINIRIPGLRKNISTINYNPKEQKLYVWDQKSANTYTLNFAPVITKPPTTTTTTTTVTRSTTTTIPTTTLSTRRTSTPALPLIPARTRCSGVQTWDIKWPDAYYGTVAKMRCPGSEQGNAIWVCGGNVTHPEWVGDTPDFAGCVSEWIREKEDKLNRGTSSGADLCREFTDTLRQQIDVGKRVTRWDIVKTVDLLRGFLDKATSERQGAGLLMGSVLKTTSMLLDQELEDSWNALSFGIQNQVASKLVEVVEDTAFFLAYDISTATSTSKDRQNKLNWSERMVSLGTRVDLIPENGAGPAENRYDNIFWITGQGDSVRLDTNAVLDATMGDYRTSSPDGLQNQNTTRHLAVVLLSFRNLGQYLKDGELYKTHLQPVDSKVLSVSAAFITRTTTVPDNEEVSVIVNKHQKLNLERPLQMTIAHENKNLGYHVCAFWDYSDRSSDGSWSRKGCYAVEVNTTHSVCQCDHMTSFAVLSSNVPFPLMGYEGDGGMIATTITAPVIQRDLPILRAGLSISLFFLVLVAATLFPLSASKRLQSDINTIHKNLVISLIATEVVFLCGIDRTLVPDVCGAVAGLLHFGLLATFTWAALEAYHLMVVLGDTIERRDRWRWYYAVGYGVPTVVVAVSAAADHTGYGTVAVCWLKTDGRFIWSFIGPCCFFILCCIVFLSITMYRLHLYSVTFSDAPKHKTVRSGVARSCALMFLLCALWSCGVLWLSNFQPRATAILFCILSSFYGITSFFLHCILPSEVRSHYSACFSKVAKRSRRRSDEDPSQNRYLSNNFHSHRSSTATSYAGTMRQDGASSYGGYYTTRTGCTTTLLPVSAAHSAALAIDQGRCVSDMDITRMTLLDNAHFTSQRGHNDGSGFDLANESGPIVPLCPHGPLPEVGCGNHHYEQPLPHVSNCSTIASGASGHYNRLHEHCPGGSHHHLAPACPQAPPVRCSHQRFNHHYETMDLPLCKECPAELGVQVQMNGSGEPKAVHYRHCFDDSQHRSVAFTAPVRRNRGPCCDTIGERPGSMRELEQGCHRSGPSHHETTGDPPQVPMAVNRGCLTQGAHPPNYPNASSSRRCQIKMGTAGLSVKPQDFSAPQRRQKSTNCHANRAGRSSDPLSTDQGYDTDSQQQVCRGCRDSQSDNDHSCSPRPPSLPKATLVVRSLENPVLPTTTLISAPQPEEQQHRIVAPIPIRRVGNARFPNNRHSGSDISECTSENDREVERIIASNHDKSAGDGGTIEDDDVAVNSSRDHNSGRGQAVVICHGEEMIDTACGGRLSVAESVTSWCAHAGSNPRAVNSSYGKSTGKNKKTDPNVIIASAKMRAENGESYQGRNKKYVYTLPGTAAAGTKAKIDLKSGGISMITNL